jgi:hypothetical protein
MSALDKQLSALSQRYGAQRAARTPSLLFEPHEAAEYDMDTIYNLGCNGLLALVRLDARYALFQSTLFAAGSKVS